MGAGVQTLMNAIKQDNLISLKFICANGLVDIYQHPDTKSYYAKVNEILLHNGYAEGNFRVSRLQKGKLKYPKVCVSKETNSESHSRPTVYIELTSSSLNSLASVYPGVDLDYSLSIIPYNNNVHYCVDDNNDSINLKSIIKSFEEAVSELSIKNGDLKNELKRERERSRNDLIEVANGLGNFVRSFENLTDSLTHTIESLYEDLLITIRQEYSDDNDEVDKENKILEGGENNGNQEE